MNHDPRKAIRQAMMIARREVTAPNKASIGGQRHMLAYITPYEAELLMRRGGSGRLTEYGVPAFDDGNGNGPGGGPGNDSNTDTAMSDPNTQTATSGNEGTGAGPTGAGAGGIGETGPDETDANLSGPVAAPVPTAPTATVPFGTPPFGQAPSALGLGLIGGLAGLGFGVPGLGTAAAGIGAAIDANNLNEQLGMMGLEQNIDAQLAAVNAMTMGAFGRGAAEQFGQTLGFDALAEAPMSAFSPPQDLPGPPADTSNPPPYYVDVKAPKQPVMQADEEAQRDLLAARNPMQQPLMYADGGAAKGDRMDPRMLPGIHVRVPHERVGRADGGPVQQPQDEDVRIDDPIMGYHSSPHEFDRFDPSKVGTGEGNQMFGHGLYFAENPQVSGQGGDYWRQFFNKMKSGPERSAAGALFANKFDAEKAIDSLTREVKYNEDRGIPGRYFLDADVEKGHRLLAEEANQALDMLRQKKTVGPRTYEVAIHARPEEFMNWDKPLSQQNPRIREFFKQRGFDRDITSPRGYTQIAGDVYFDAAIKSSGEQWRTFARPDDVKKLSEDMLAAGIPGIKYLDAGSRDAGEGTRNYVVFHPKHLEIKRRYADGGEITPPRDLGADPTVQRALDLTRQNDVSPMEAARSVASGETYAGKDAPAYSQAGAEAGRLSLGRGVSGSAGFLPSSDQAPLEGLPTRIKVPLTGEVITAGPNHQVRAIAEQYMRDAGLPYNPPTKYAKVDAARAKRIADEYERMADDPDHPLVKAAYDAMIRETMAQYQAAKAAGFKAEFWDPEKERDPYEASPRLAIEDVNKNHHMYVFPTYFGYGSKKFSAEDVQKNPLLADSGERWNGYPVTVNDIFRAVHDYFGHAKEGVGFRHDGEENAWRSHASMYSPLARLAMTSETRGQNSWLNFGPHGEKNRNARTDDTVFADQKIGVMAPWTTHEGAEDFLHPEDREAMEKAYKQYRRAYGGRLGYADGGMMGDDPTVQRALDITRGAQPAVPQMAANIQPQAMPMADPSSMMDQYRGTGLSFPEKDNAARLALKAKRENLLAQGKAAGNPANPRMVIRAPKASDGEKQLPDFVVGQLNHNDWTDRHEAILSPSEIHQASQWYKRVKGTFDTYYPNDPELSKKMMRAWLVAQQNVSPAGAMNNVLMQREQMLRGDPEETWQAGGMPMPTQAARSVLRQQPIEMGVGQKIADFVDSAEGKPVRSWMGNHPDGGAPFVVDVHTARDTGMVDEELLNHLRRLGYNQDDLSKVKIDLKGSPTEASYENRAQWGRGLTKYLNSIGWQGKENWTPEEIQAVGWMGMTKLTRNAEEDSESGLNRNLRRLSFETAPGEGSPWEKKYGQAFASLSPEQQRMVTHAINEEALKHAAELSGIDVRHVVHGTGAWENQQSPASVAQALMTQKGGDIAANALGYLLNQTEVWHNRVKPLGGTKNPAGFAIDFIQKNGHELADPAYLQDFWQKITEADPHNIIKGYQPIRLPTGEVGIRAIITKGGEKTKGLIESLVGQDGPIKKVIEESPHDLEVMGHEAEVTRAVNDWKENPNGEAYMERLVKLLGPDSRAKLAAIRPQLEKKLEAHLNEIGGGKNRQIGKSTGRQKAQLDKAGGGFISKDPELLERALRLTATNRPMVALADLFQRQLRGRPPS
jgi:hypothetical protein